MDWMDTGKVVRVRLESAGWIGWTGERLDALIQGIQGGRYCREVVDIHG